MVIREGREHSSSGYNSVFSVRPTSRPCSPVMFCCRGYVL